MKRFLISMMVVLASGLCLSPSTATAQQKLVVTPLGEKKVTGLPAGPLFWRIENFTAFAQAQAAAGHWGLVAESAGKVWLFTLGPPGGSSAGGTKVAEIGPIPRIVATQYLLRINEGSGPPVASRPRTRIQAPKRSTCSLGRRAVVLSWDEAYRSRRV